MKLWRIAAETVTFSCVDLSGGGAAKYPGRWNEAGQSVVYAAPSIALAVLETAAHVDSMGLPLNRFVVEITVPDEVWEKRTFLDVSKLPSAWIAIPHGQASMKAGAQWLHAALSAVLMVPSVIVQEELIALINPKHSDSASLTAKSLRAFEYNRLFRHGN